MDNICPSDFETDSCLALNCEADLAQKGSQRWHHTRPGGNHSPVDTGERPIWDHLREQYHAHPNTGVGVWSLAASTRAMHEGVSGDGSHLFAAFPYTAYTELSDDDVKALGDESQQPTWPHSRQRRR